MGSHCLIQWSCRPRRTSCRRQGPFCRAFAPDRKRRRRACPTRDRCRGRHSRPKSSEKQPPSIASPTASFEAQLRNSTLSRVGRCCLVATAYSMTAVIAKTEQVPRPPWLRGVELPLSEERAKIDRPPVGRFLGHRRRFLRGRCRRRLRGRGFGGPTRHDAGRSQCRCGQTPENCVRFHHQVSGCRFQIADCRFQIANFQNTFSAARIEARPAVFPMDRADALDDHRVALSPRL